MGFSVARGLGFDTKLSTAGALKSEYRRGEYLPVGLGKCSIPAIGEDAFGLAIELWGIQEFPVGLGAALA
jgi:hypothetical protein